MKIKRSISLILAFVLVFGLAAPGFAGVRAAETEDCAHTFDDGTCTVCGYSVLDSNWLAPEIAAGDYAMVVIPDMQDLVCYHPEIYYATINWIAENEKTYNIVAALNMGDMVNDVTTDTLTTDEEWAISVAGMEALENSGIAWMPMMGNHDKSAYFNQYYPYENFSSREWFGGSYDENLLDHTYWFVTAGDREYLILSLGWAPEQAVLDWAKGIVEQYPEKSVILTTHAMMNKDGYFLEAGDSACPSSYISGVPNGDDIWEAFCGYENLTLCLSGHISSMNLSTYTAANGAGRDVWSMLVDAQDNEETDALGMLALLTFDAETNNVAVNWYSTRYDALYGNKNQFTITMPHVTAEHACQYTADVKEPTCTEPGGTTYTCGICGSSYVTDETPTLGHSYEGGVCTRCGEAEPATLTKQKVATGFTCQDGAIFGGKAFLISSGTCKVFDMETLTSLGSFTLAKNSAITAHGNTVSFGSTYYAEGDAYPLLYVSVWNKYSVQTDRREGTCCVYRITETDGTFSSTLVQVIEIGFTEDLSLWKSEANNGDVRPYGSFTVDTDTNTLYAYVMRDAEPVTRFFGFDLPGLEEGAYNDTYGCNVVTLTADDIEKQFDTPYMNYQQGACYYGGKIYSTESFVSIEVPPVLRVIDLAEQKEETVYNLTDFGLTGQACMLTFDPDTGALHYAVDGGTLYVLTLQDHEHCHQAVVTAPTCTEGGYTTYTCSCGDSYVTDEVAALGHNYVDGICANCGKEEPPVLTWENVASNVSCQDGAIFDGKAFLVSSGTCKVYDLNTKKNLTTFTLGGGITAHGNTTSFGNAYYAEGDKYPLLYVSVWNKYSTQTDRMEGTCCVYRITETDGAFAGDLVQVIEIGFTEDLTLWKSKENNGDVRPYGSFTVDTDNDILYAYVMRDADPATRFFGFELPGLEEGTYHDTYGCNVVTLTADDIAKQFDTPYMNYQQGACYYDGKIYSTESFVQNNNDPALRVIDLQTQTQETVYDLTEYGLDSQSCMLSFDPDTGSLYYSVDTGALYILDLHNHVHQYTAEVTAPTCTEDGYTTYTCTCGDSYVADEVAATGHSYDKGICTGCGDSLGYVAWNGSTETGYTHVAAALDAAKAEETVSLLADCAENTVTVIPGTTLDLNGFALTADYAVGFNTAHIIDSVGSGRLITEAVNVILDEENAMIPVYDGTAYLFTKAGFAIRQDKSYTGEGMKIQGVACPVNLAAVELLKDGGADNNIQIVIILSWDTEEGTGSQEFVFTDEIVGQIYSSNTGVWNVYGSMFSMVVTGFESIQNLNAKIAVVSGTNAVYVSANSVSIT